MQTDGNLVLYCKGNALWSSETDGKTVSGGLVFQADGNLVLYDPEGTPLWDYGTLDTEGSKMVLQDDGNLVLYTDDRRAVWDTGTHGQCYGHYAYNYITFFLYFVYIAFYAPTKKLEFRSVRYVNITFTTNTISRFGNYTIDKIL